MARCLVTGGAGFIGSHLVDALLRAGYSVAVLDNFSTGRMQNLSQALDYIDLHVASVESLQQIKEAIKGSDVVFHLAASSSVSESLRNPFLAHNHNVTGTINLLDAAREEKSVRKVIFASSAAVYGSNRLIPKTETFQSEPINPYGLSKYMCEQYCEMYTNLFDFEIACMRFFNAYGPRQNADSDYSGVISKFLKCYLNGVSPKVYGDGTQSRDFVYVDDIVQALLLSIKTTGESFGVYNVCTNHSHTLLDLLRFLSEGFEKELAPEFLPARLNDIHQSVGSYRKICQAFGFQPKFSFREGLKRLIDFAMDEEDSKRRSFRVLSRKDSQPPAPVDQNLIGFRGAFASGALAGRHAANENMQSEWVLL